MNGILALDQGTTSSRAILFDQSGQMLAKAQYPLHQIYPKPGWVEHDPAEILETELRAVRDVLAQTENVKIVGIGITNQRETTVLWEKDTGRPVCNAIVWQCRRTAPICEKLKADGLEQTVQMRTGLTIDPYFSATKIAWLLDETPGLRIRAERGEILFGTVESWLIWNLTGGKRHVTDVSNAARTMLFDIDRLAWNAELCKAMRVPMSVLPEPVGNSELLGTVCCKGLEALAGVPICGAAGDQQAALFGQGCFRAGMAKNTYGTGCFTLLNTGAERISSRDGLLTTVGWRIAGKTSYVLEGSAFNAGSAIQWLRDGAGVIASAQECDRQAEKTQDNGGVYFVPAFTGLGAPYWDPDARGCFFGLTRGAGKPALCRAVLESIAYEVTDLVAGMQRDLGAPPEELRVDGGACVSDVLMQFQADLLNVPVNRPQNPESTAFGAACMAGLAVGLWPEEKTLEALRRVDRIFRPDMEQERRCALYAEWKKAVSLARAWGEK